MTAQITIRGARLHNLKNVTLTIPKNQLAVLTGLSGSGKSTLGFDILNKEGQRQYTESYVCATSDCKRKTGWVSTSRSNSSSEEFAVTFR